MDARTGCKASGKTDTGKKKTTVQPDGGGVISLDPLLQPGHDHGHDGGLASPRLGVDDEGRVGGALGQVAAHLLQDVFLPAERLALELAEVQMVQRLQRHPAARSEKAAHCTTVQGTTMFPNCLLRGICLPFTVFGKRV